MFWIALWYSSYHVCHSHLEASRSCEWRCSLILLIPFCALTSWNRVSCLSQVWNEAWVSYAEEDPSWYYALLGVTLGAYTAAITLAGV
jgi:hypothetical protein